MTDDTPSALCGRPGRCKPTLVDAHVHVWDPAIRAQPWMKGNRFTPLRRRFDLGDLAAAAAGTAVKHAVLIQNLASTAECLELLQLAARPARQRDMHIRGVVGWVDLRAPAVSEQIDALREAPGGQLLVGVRHPLQDEAEPDWAMRADVLVGLAAVAAAGLTADILARSDQLPAVLHAVRRTPSGRFVLDHLARPPISTGLASPSGQAWLAMINALATEPNVAVKVSGLLTQSPQPWTAAAIRPWVQAAFDAFGPDRTMFASDWPVCLLAASYGTAVSTSYELIPTAGAQDLDAVYRTTAEHWYGFTE